MKLWRFYLIFCLSLIKGVKRQITSLHLPYYFETSLELNQTESVRLTQFTTHAMQSTFHGIEDFQNISDDLIIYGKNKHDHDRALRAVL